MRRVFVFIALVCFVSSSFSTGDQPVSNPQVEQLKTRLLRDVEKIGEARRAGKNEALTKQRFAGYGGMADSMHAYDVLHYQLDITFDIPAPTLSGVVTAQCKSNEVGLSSISIHLVDLTVDEILRDGAPTAYTHAGGEIDVDLGGAFNTGQEFEVSIRYHGNPTAGYYDDGSIFFTTVQPSAARNWWPCYDEPWDKATAAINATVPTGYIVASNGTLTETVPHPGDNTITYKWYESYPVATYLVSVAISRYETWTDTYYPVTGGDPMDVIFYVPAYLVDEAQYDFGRVVEMIEYFAPLFNEYPFVDEKYGMAIAPMGGAMEHQTCTTWPPFWTNGDRQNEWIVAHELAHQWWGDMVTLVNWCEMWLNEGFATYSEALWAEYLYGEEGLRIYTELAIQDYFKGWESASSRNRFPIYCPPPGQLFSPAEYEKGGCVLHMLRYLVGTDMFFEALRTYGERYAYANTSTEDLKNVFEEVTEQQLDWFFDQWIYDQGYPEYEYMWEVEGIGGGQYEVTVNVNQIQTSAPVFTMPVEFTAYTQSGEVTETVILDQAHQSFQFTIDDTPDSVLLDPFGWILKEVTHITSPLVSYTDHSLIDATGDGDGVPDPGETVELVVDVHNTGVGIEYLTASISVGNPDIHITDGTAEFGECGYNQTVSNATNPFVFEVDIGALSKVVLFVLEMSDGGEYTTMDSVYITVGPATVLLVDDDVGEEYEDYYREGLLMTYPFDYWEVTAQDVPSETLSHYEAVVWFTGDDRSSTRTRDEQEALQQYLDNGGNLFISGQDIGYDLAEDGSVEDAAFYHDCLHAVYVGDVSAEKTISGVSGDPITGDFQFLSLEAGGAENQNSPSIIEPSSGANTIFTYSATGNTAGIKYGGESKVVYLAFGYEGVGAFIGSEHAKGRATIMDRVVDWFRCVPIKGDVNEDGTVNVVDVVIGINIILGIVDPSPMQLWAADFTDDGKVNVLDIIQIVNEILGSPVVR